MALGNPAQVDARGTLEPGHGPLHPKHAQVVIAIGTGMSAMERQGATVDRNTARHRRVEYASAGREPEQ